MAVWNPSTKRFVEDLVTPLHDADLNAAYDAAVADAKAAFSAGSGIGLVNGVISLAQQGATVNQVLTWNGSAYVPATPATGGTGGTTYANGTGLTLIGNVFAADIGTGAGQVAAGNHTHAIYQISSAKGQANGYAPLDANAQLALSGLSPGAATAGQALVLSNGVWTPTTLAAGTTYTGTNPITVSGGAVSVATATNSQLGVVRPDGSTIQISGGVITSVGGSGLPVAIDATLNGTSGQTAIDPTKNLIYLSPGSGFTDASPAPYTLANASTNRWIWLIHIGAGVASIGANVNGTGTVFNLYPGDVIPILYDSIAGTYRASGALDTGGLAAAGALSATDTFVITQAGIDTLGTLPALTAYVQSHFQSWITSGRPSLATQYAIGFNTTTGRFDFWNGTAWNQHVRVSDLSATSSQLFGGSGTDGTVTAVSVGSKLSLSAGTLDVNATTTAAAVYAIPAGERTVAVTGGSSAVVLTATDHSKTVGITGAVGSTLSVDGTTSAGFRAFIANKSTGVATYSGITGDNGTTSLAPGASTTIYRLSGAFYATAAAGSSATSTSYTMGTSQVSGLSGNAVTLTFAPISGTWPTGVTLTAAQSGVTGSFSTTTLTPTSGTSTPVSCTFTPTATGTATFSVTSGGAMTNPANVTYSVVAAATAYTTSLSGTTGSVSAPMTMTFTPSGGGGWPNSEVITPTLSGVTGSFSPTTVSTTPGLTSAVTCLFTPTATGTAALSSTTSPSMTNTTGSQNYTVTAAAATAYTSALSSSSGAVGSPVTLTVTPTSGTWPVGEAITLTNTSLSGSWASASGGTLSGSVLTPTAGSAAASAQFTPTGAAVGTINSTTSPSMTNSTGGLTYTSLAVATSFGTSPTSVTVASGSGTTFTFTPSGGVWGPTETIGLALVTVAGAFSSLTNATITGSGPYTITPTRGNSTNVTVVFTPSSSNGTSGSITVSGVNITATNTSISVSVAASVPSFPTLPGTGLNSSAISVAGRWKADAGVSLSGGAGTVADQSGNSHTLTATVGVSVGANVGSNSLPSIAFAGSSQASNSGINITGIDVTTGFLTSAMGTTSPNFTMFFCWKNGSTFSSQYENVFSLSTSADDPHIMIVYDYGSGHFKLWDKSQDTNFSNATDLGAATANQLNRLVWRVQSSSSSSIADDIWFNGTKTNIFPGGTPLYSGGSKIGFGQSVYTGYSYGGQHILWCESGLIKGALPDTNCAGGGASAALDDYLLSKWG